MKRIALSAVGAAVAALTACSHNAAHTAAPANHGSAVVPVSCAHQYHAWEHGRGTGLMAALETVASAETAGSRHKLRTALKKARPAVAMAAHHPMPACADPMGYWSVLLMHVNAGAASKTSAPSMRAAMKAVPNIERKLTAELKRTAF